jgi:nitrate reductase gamma subunit
VPWGLVAAGTALVVVGLAGYAPAGLGFGMLFAAGALLVTGVLLFAVVALTKAGDTARLAGASGSALRFGAAGYALAVCALAGHYVHETLQGRMELYWIIFGPLVLYALFSVETGLYRKLVKANLPSWQRFRHFLRREDSDPAAMRRALVDEVLLQKALWKASRLRWTRHALIFWGFGGMFLVEIAAVVLREGFPAFGLRDIWREAGHPVRIAFDFAYDFTGVMILLGCLLALAWRASVGDRPERKFSDTPMVAFLLLVVVTGFVIEGWRIAQSPADAAHAASFAGKAVAHVMDWAGLASPALFQPLWIVHAVAACALIAWLPATRLVHSCATPVGRLMNSQKGLLAARKLGVLGAMLRRGPGSPAVGSEGTPAAR